MHEETASTVDRRTVLRTAGLLGAGTVAAAGGPASAAAQSDPFDGWFDGVSNYEGVVDETGSEAVTVEVGAPGNNGAFAYGPAAVRVDPGTRVVWEWTGEGGLHDVVAEDGSYAGDAASEAGHTFEHTFEAAGVSLYYCSPHEALGMKGAVVVGDAVPDAPAAGATGDAGAFVPPDYDGWFDDVDNFDGTVDMTGSDEVTVAVGAEGNDGAFAFDPPAIRVDPDTTVVWEWTGEGGGHNVADPEVGYESPLQSEAGATYALTFSGEGLSTYACTPHEAVGMKGAVVVGNPAAAAAGGGSTGELGLWALVVAAVLSPFAVGEYFHRKHAGEDPQAPAPPS